MSTMTTSRPSILMETVKPLLNVYEEFMVQEDVPGVFGYVMTFKTNVYIHRKHTRQNLYIPHSVYQASSFTALPNIAFIEEWLKQARVATQKLLNKGEYSDEVLVGGKWQPITRQYNSWIYYDRNNRMLFGERHLNQEGSSHDNQ